MWSFSRALWLACGLLLALASGCASARRCGGPELCNERDDDCDGRIDEGFVDERGRYTGVDHCGRCGVACDDVFPTAQSTRCEADQPVPMCKLASCAPGFHAVDGVTCARSSTVLCLPCEADAECSTRYPGARCVERANERRCGIPCSASARCPAPFQCDLTSGQCVPDSALCACQGVSETVEVACLAQGSASGILCAGLATCGPTGLSDCEIAAQESCDGQDNDCDGQVDEDFVDAQGRYVNRLHCGACGQPCSPPGEHYLASCDVEPSGMGVRCNIACEPGFVDVDGIEGNGCECQRFDGSSAPASSGGDNDCDGLPDDDSSFVHVTTSGDDNGLGTLLSPMRSLQAAVNRARAENKVVLVAQGAYDAFSMAPGVAVFGGYRTDFRARDAALYPVVVEHAEPRDGAPVLTCSGVHTATVIDGLTLVGQDAASAGVGSTAVRFEDCSDAVKLRQVVVIAGRGADGQRGADAAQRLPNWASSLSDLNGQNGSPGAPSFQQQPCAARPGGPSALKSCGGRDVSGGAGGAGSCLDSGCVNGVKPCGNAGCSDFTQNGVCDIQAVLALAVPNPAAGPGRGVAPGRAGASTYNAPSTRRSCNFCDDNPTLPRLGDDGGEGQPGTTGSGGMGCTDPTLRVDAQGRISAAGGAEGTGGQDGSGGGGGSAGSGFDVIRGTPNDSGVCVDVAGGGGGSGGSGGCGAPGGGAGQGGGASVAVLVRPTAQGLGPTFEQVRVVTASGGRGGDGGIGAAGGRGGLGAPGGVSRFWCARSGGRGGDGGEGGAGGGGGGGCGGGSHAVLFAAPGSGDYRNQLGAALQIELAGVAGQGGSGGFSPGNAGSAGFSGPDAVIR